MENWISSENNTYNIILSSRVRLARNIAELPFPHKLDIENAKAVVKKFEDSFYVSSPIKSCFKTIKLWETDPSEMTRYFERHLISDGLVKNKDGAAFAINKDETTSIMVNEEDHVRIQCMTSGLNLKDCLDEAYKLDNLLEEKMHYAFDYNIGYLTACPTNVGTGLRGSVMLHLPCLTMNNEMNGILNAVTQVGMTIRGLYGEGSEAYGNLYQISNQITLGLNEEEILNNLSAVVNQIINQEMYCRDEMLKKYKYELYDKIFRTYGILKNAILLSSKECINNLSNVRLGVELGIIKDVKASTLNYLLVETQPASLQHNYKTVLSSKMRDIKRAEFVKNVLNK